ncbi:MAG: TatA/E family twin arginine-targeting protein translocase [Actinobacteria bacterium]|nr:TatA/E family twin arginine-targeting protein translocase [Actinomycetota bacterium]
MENEREVEKVFGLGVPELIIILVIALIIFGPRKLPEIGQALGKGIREFKKGTQEIQKDLESAVKIDDEPKAETKPKAAESAKAEKSEEKEEKAS